MDYDAQSVDGRSRGVEPTARAVESKVLASVFDNDTINTTMAGIAVRVVIYIM